MRIALVSAEVAPLAKSGGLGDVVAALARYLTRAGHDVRVFLPLYGNLRTEATPRPVEGMERIPVPLGARTVNFALKTVPLPRAGLDVHLVDCPPLYAGRGLYTETHEEPLRFSLLTRAAIESFQRMGWGPDVAHVHDWHTALMPLYLRSVYGWDRLFRRTRTVLTIHNIAFQGVTGADRVTELGLSPVAHLLHQDHLREGRVGFLETGILYADAITTVSHTHAREIQSPGLGMGLDGLLRARSGTVLGIPNGIDVAEWSPEHDVHLPFHYSRDDLSGKAKNKAHLLQAAGLRGARRTPVLGIVSRLTGQKGFELCFDVLPSVLRHQDVRLLVLGTGFEKYEAFFANLQRAFPDKVRYHRGYSEELAHRIEAAADVFLMPSLYEPCGLNQMYSQRYGTLPVVHKTGGLADTVVPFDPRTRRGTGFVFEHHTASGLRWALDLALATYRNEALWTSLQRDAMAQDFSWERRIGLYDALYRRLTE